jgi:hypothetical protein
MSNIKIENCPCCKSKAELLEKEAPYTPYGQTYQIRCQRCWIQTPECNLLDYALAIWNTERK